MRLITRLGMALALGPALLGATPQARSADPEGGAFVVDFTVDRTLLDANGAQYGPPARPVQYRLSRARTASGWRITLRFDNAANPAAGPGSPPSPFSAGWIEMDDDGTPPRLFDGRGDRVHADLPLVGLRNELARSLDDTFLVDAVSAVERHAELRKAFGAPTGRLRGLDRFIRRNGERMEELLVEAETGLPRTVTVTRDGVVESHTTYEYGARATGGLVRRVTVTEMPVPDRPGHKWVTRTTVTRVVVDGGR